MNRNIAKLLLILALAVIQIASQTSKSCEWESKDGAKYSFTSLQQDKGWKMHDLKTKSTSLFGIKYIFNFCKELNPKCDLDGKVSHAGVYEVLEVLGQETDTCEVLGQFDKQVINTVTYDGKHGINFTYTDGDKCVGSENPAENGGKRKSSFIILCGGKDNEWVQSPVNTHTVTRCSKEFVIHHPAGCPVSGPSGFLGLGLLGWIILIGLAYLIVGVIYNHMNNKRGMQSIPNIEFWKEIPELVSEGVRYSTDKVKSMSVKNPKEMTSLGPDAPKTTGGYESL